MSTRSCRRRHDDKSVIGVGGREAPPTNRPVQTSANQRLQSWRRRPTTKLSVVRLIRYNGPVIRGTREYAGPGRAGPVGQLGRPSRHRSARSTAAHYANADPDVANGAARMRPANSRRDRASSNEFLHLSLSICAHRRRNASAELGTVSSFPRRVSFFIVGRSAALTTATKPFGEINKSPFINTHAVLASIFGYHVILG